MRILVFSWRDPKHPLAGGAEQVMHEHMKGWVKYGYQVTLFSSLFKDGLKNEEIDGINIVRAGNQYLGVQLEGYKYYQKNKNRFDVIVDQFHGLPFFTPLYAGKPILAVVQETASEVWFMNPYPTPLRQIIGFFGFYLEPFIYKLYKNIQFMTGSESAKKDIANFGIPISSIKVVPHGVIIFKPSEDIGKEKITTISFLGILTKDKGIFDALESFRLIAAKIPEVQFWLMGKAENRKYQNMIYGKIKGLGIYNKVKLWGFVSQKKKFELLKRSTLLINPSVREGWGLVNIEANSMGTPVIAYNSPGLKDSVKDSFNGLICSENNPKALADLVIKILGDKILLNKLEKNSVTWAKRFTWNKSLQQSLQLIKILNEN